MAKIIVVGGSLGGLFAANLLLKKGHEVIVLEKVVGSLDGRGAGIVTHETLRQALDICGVDTDNLGVPISQRVTLDRNGQSIVDLEIPQIVTSWSRLYHLLKENFPSHRYLGGKSVKDITQTANHVTVYCEDGSSYTGDLIIASDGLRSSVRHHFAPQIQPKYAGYVAWRGVCDEHVLSHHTLTTLFETFGFGLPPGEQILGYPVAGNNNNITAGHRRYNFVWYKLADDNKLVDLLTDADGNYYDQGISPIKVNWRHVADVRDAARKNLAPQWGEILEKTGLIFLQAIYDVYSEKIAFDRVALMGDASFVARPHVGMGVTKAAEDAMSLCNAIEKFGANSRALAAYETLRLPIGQKVIERARYLGEFMTEQGQEALRNNLKGISQRVMEETAVDISHLLHH